MNAPLVVAHAACKGHAPENTLSGVRTALKLGADAIEIDIHCTRDGSPVLLHDATVDRTTDGSGDLDALTLRQVRRLNIDGGEHIPTLRDALREVDGRALVVLEIKPAGIEQATLDVVRRARALDWCTVHSFLPAVIQEVRRLEPRMPCSLLIGRPIEDWTKLFGFALSLGASGVSVHYSQVTPELVRAASLRTLRVSAWTANRRDDVRRVAAAGVAAITSDYPDRVRKWLPRARA